MGKSAPVTGYGGIFRVERDELIVSLIRSCHAATDPNRHCDELVLG